MGGDRSARLVTRAIENAQKKSGTASISATPSEYDDVLNKRRGVIYGHRREVSRAKL
jgi:preprotein translocase subunit SecA